LRQLLRQCSYGFFGPQSRVTFNQNCPKGDDQYTAGLLFSLRAYFKSNQLFALGHEQTSRARALMSALPPKADIRQRNRDVRFVPKADIKFGLEVEEASTLYAANSLDRYGPRLAGLAG
jgi:hypothetical protein